MIETSPSDRSTHAVPLVARSPRDPVAAADVFEDRRPRSLEVCLDYGSPFIDVKD